MSADSIVATAAGVSAAGAALIYDQSLAMASAGGLAMFLAVSATIPLQQRFFFSIGSFIFAYIVGLVCIATAASADPETVLAKLGTVAPLIAFMCSSFASSAFGSLQKWADGGPEPRWLSLILRLLPFRVKKGDPNE